MLTFIFVKKCVTNQRGELTAIVFLNLSFEKIRLITSLFFYLVIMCESKSLIIAIPSRYFDRIVFIYLTT